MKRLSSSNSSISKSYDHNWFSLNNRFHVKLCEFSKNPQKIIFSESANQKNIQTRQIVQNLIAEISLGKHILNIYGKNRKKLEIHQKSALLAFFLQSNRNFAPKSGHNFSKSDLQEKFFGSEKMRRTNLFNFVYYFEDRCLVKNRDMSKIQSKSALLASFLQ